MSYGWSVAGCLRKQPAGHAELLAQLRLGTGWIAMICQELPKARLIMKAPFLIVKDHEIKLVLRESEVNVENAVPVGVNVNGDAGGTAEETEGAVISEFQQKRISAAVFASAEGDESLAKNGPRNWDGHCRRDLEATGKRVGAPLPQAKECKVVTHSCERVNCRDRMEAGYFWWSLRSNSSGVSQCAVSRSESREATRS